MIGRTPVRLILSTVLLLVLFGCIWDNEKVLPLASGKSGELVVVMDSSMWSGPVGHQIKRCFASPQEGLPQSEPYFNVIEVTRPNFSQIFKTTRNIIVIEKNASEKSTYVIKEDAWAKNQLVLLINVNNEKDAEAVIKNSCQGLLDRFREEEIKRLQWAFNKLKDQAIMSEVEKAVGIKTMIPSDYKVAKKEENFIWLRKDFQHQGHQINMGLIMYKSPYDSIESLDDVNIIAERNRQAKAVEGPVEGSHMSTYEEYPPVVREIAVEKRYVKELRGLWNMKGAFMGGPFVHYSFVDKSGQFIVHIDGYVFAPKFDKREYLRELEAIGLSASGKIF